MCINCMHDDRFLVIWETYFVQRSYANAGPAVKVATAPAVGRFMANRLRRDGA